MKLIIWFVAALFPLVVFGQTDSIHQKFDFWVGHWDLTWDEGDGKIGTGTNHIYKTLDGKVIQENFEGLTGQNTGFKGISLSVYNPRTQSWHQAWTDNQGGYFDFIGDTDGPDPIFKTKVKEKDNKKIVSRMVFKDRQKDHFVWVWEKSEDGGETWKVQWLINYQRRK